LRIFKKLGKCKIYQNSHAQSIDFIHNLFSLIALNLFSVSRGEDVTFSDSYRYNLTSFLKNRGQVEDYEKIVFYPFIPTMQSILVAQ